MRIQMDGVERLADRASRMSRRADVGYVRWSLFYEYGEQIPGYPGDRWLYCGPQTENFSKTEEKEYTLHNLERLYRRIYYRTATFGLLMDCVSELRDFSGRFWTGMQGQIFTVTAKMLYQFVEDLNSITGEMQTHAAGFVDSVMSSYLCAQNYDILSDYMYFGRYHFQDQLDLEDAEEHFSLGRKDHLNMCELLEACLQLTKNERRETQDMLPVVLNVFRCSRSIHTVIYRWRPQRIADELYVYEYKERGSQTLGEYAIAPGKLKVIIKRRGISQVVTIKTEYEEYESNSTETLEFNVVENGVVKEPEYCGHRAFPAVLTPYQLRCAIREYAHLKYGDDPETRDIVLGDIPMIVKQQYDIARHNKMRRETCARASEVLGYLPTYRDYLKPEEWLMWMIEIDKVYSRYAYTRWWCRPARSMFVCELMLITLLNEFIPMVTPYEKLESLDPMFPKFDIKKKRYESEGVYVSKTDPDGVDVVCTYFRKLVYSMANDESWRVYHYYCEDLVSRIEGYACTILQRMVIDCRRTNTTYWDALLVCRWVGPKLKPFFIFATYWDECFEMLDENAVLVNFNE